MWYSDVTEIFHFFFTRQPADLETTVGRRFLMSFSLYLTQQIKRVSGNEFGRLRVGKKQAADAVNSSVDSEVRKTMRGAMGQERVGSASLVGGSAQQQELRVM